MSDMQLDIFGGETNVNRVDYNGSKKGTRISIKQAFRYSYGVNREHFCKECEHCVKSDGYYKCEKMGLSRSEATDIRLKDYACGLFKRSEQ